MKRWPKEIDDYLLDLLGKQAKKELVSSLDHGKTIVISGNYSTGKTTLLSILNSLGYNAVEADNVYEIKLTKPLATRIHNLDDQFRIFIQAQKPVKVGAVESGIFPRLGILPITKDELKNG